MSLLKVAKCLRLVQPDMTYMSAMRNKKPFHSKVVNPTCPSFRNAEYQMSDLQTVGKKIRQDKANGTCEGGTVDHSDVIRV